MLKRFFLLVVCFSFWVAPLAAQDNSTPTISQRLSNAEGAFENGAYQSLRAIEELIQTQYRYGIGRGAGMFIGLRNRDLANSQPETREPDTFKNMIAKLSSNLENARATLSQTSPINAAPFVVDLKDLWFDVNGNGSLEDGEEATNILGQLLTRRRGNDELLENPMEVRFDGADHAWLMAYTHALSAMAEAILAFDPTPVFADLLDAEVMLSDIPTIEYTFDTEKLNLRLSKLQEKLISAEAAVRELGELRQPLVKKRTELLSKARNKATSKSENEVFLAQANNLQKQLREPKYNLGSVTQNVRFIKQEIRSIEAKLPSKNNKLDGTNKKQLAQQRSFGDTRNAIYALIKILQQPPNKTHIANVAQNMRAMFSQNQLFWEHIMLEKDNDREWVPNPSQSGAFGVTIDAELAEVWQTILEDALAVLDGRLLIPHPLLDQDTGINLALWFDNPSSLDLVGWFHGRAAYPYLARGPKITTENWRALQRLTQGNAFAFAIYLN